MFNHELNNLPLGLESLIINPKYDKPLNHISKLVKISRIHFY
jgi:hypothetical protein